VTFSHGTLDHYPALSEQHDITLHGRANRGDLSDPDDRFFLRIEVAHAPLLECHVPAVGDAQTGPDARPHSSGERG
jgi:hypothetical protein